MEFEEGIQGSKESLQNSRKRMPSDVLDSEKKKQAKVTTIDLSHRDPFSKVRLHVSNIPYEIKWQDLKDLFKEKIGQDVCFAEIYNGADGRPSGVGVVEVKNPELAKLAIESLHRHEVQGRTIIVREETDDDVAKRQYASAGGYGGMPSCVPPMNKSSMMPGYGSGSSFGMDASDYGSQMLFELGIDPDNITSQVFVANVDYRATPSDIEDMFRIAGNVLNVEQKVDKEGKPRGMFVVRFDHPIESVQAISLFNHQHYRDRQLTVKMDRGGNAKPQIVPLGMPAGLQSIGKGLGPNGKPLFNIGHIANSMTLSNLTNAHQKKKLHVPQFAERNFGGMVNQRLALMSGDGMASNPSSAGIAQGIDLDTIVEATVKAVTGRLGGMFGNVNAAMDMDKSQDYTGMSFDGGKGIESSLYTQFEDDSSYVQFGAYGAQAVDTNSSVMTPGGVECHSIVLRNLPLIYNWQKLKDKCKEIGEVKFAEVKTGPGGRSLGIGTANFKSSSDAKKAVAQFNGATVDGRRLDVRLGYI